MKMRYVVPIRVVLVLYGWMDVDPVLCVGRFTTAVFVSAAAAMAISWFVGRQSHMVTMVHMKESTLCCSSDAMVCAKTVGLAHSTEYPSRHKQGGAEDL